MFESTLALVKRPIDKNQGRPLQALNALKSALEELQKLPGNVGGYRPRILKAIEKTAQDILASANYYDNFPAKK